jgi:aminopeptidase 2
MFESFITGDETAIPPNLRRAVFIIVLQRGSRKEYDALFDFYRRVKAPEEKETVLRCLGFTHDLDCIRELLALLLTDEIKKAKVVLCNSYP